MPLSRRAERPAEMSLTRNRALTRLHVMAQMARWRSDVCHSRQWRQAVAAGMIGWRPDLEALLKMRHQFSVFLRSATAALAGSHNHTPTTRRRSPTRSMAAGLETSAQIMAGPIQAGACPRSPAVRTTRIAALRTREISRNVPSFHRRTVWKWSTCSLESICDRSVRSSSDYSLKDLLMMASPKASACRMNPARRHDGQIPRLSMSAA